MTLTREQRDAGLDKILAELNDLDRPAKTPWYDFMFPNTTALIREVQGSKLFDESIPKPVITTFRRAAWWIFFANIVDLLLTLRALKHGHIEGNPLAAFLIDTHLIIPLKILIPGFFLLGGYWTRMSCKLTEVSARRAWWIAGVYFTVLVVGVLANWGPHA